MNFEDSSLYLEVKNIMQAGANPVNYFWSAQLHLSTGEILDAFKVISIDNKRDYERNFTDEIIVSLLIPLGKYAKRIYPSRNNLEVTLKRKLMDEIGANENQEKGPQVERYVAVLINQGNPLIEGDDSNIPSEEALDLSNFITVELQLIPKSIDLMRMKSIGGVYRGSNTEDTVKTLLTKESQSLDIDQVLLPRGVDMVPTNGKNNRTHIVIPHGVKLINLPQYVQDKCGGIYPTGLGFYYQDKQWYLYPLYDTERFEDSTTKVTIINVPGNKLVGVERSYRNDGSNTIILATGEAQFKDLSDQTQLTLGNGARFADASKFIDGFVTTAGNKTVAARGNNVNEVKSVDRASGNNNIHMSDSRITANVYKEYSELARRDGSVMNLLWENADPTLIYPGLPIKILYLEDDDIRELKGVILKAAIYTHMKGQVMFTNMHHCNIGISVFVNRRNIQI